MRYLRSLTVAALIILFVPCLRADSLPGTKPLTIEGDFAAQMVDGIHDYLYDESTTTAEQRRKFWKPDFSSADAYAKSVQPNRERLAKILGVVDTRVPARPLEFVASTE